MEFWHWKDEGFPPGSSRRVTVQIVALVWLWMNIGGELHHTDAFRTSLITYPAACGHGSPAASAADDCTACQWAQGAQMGSAACHVLLPFSFTGTVYLASHLPQEP